MRRQLVCLVLPECIEASEAPQKRMGSEALGQRGGSSEGRNMLPRCCPPRGHCPECLPVATARALHAPRAARQTRAKVLESRGGGAEKPSPRRLKEETCGGSEERAGRAAMTARRARATLWCESAWRTFGGG